MKDRTGIFRWLLSVALLLGIWQTASVFFSPMVVPSVPETVKTLAKIIMADEFLSVIGVTFSRLIAGLAAGVFLGIILGLLSGISRVLEDLLAPFISVLQAVPPVSWVVLALVWFGFNGKPCIFIVVTATVPTIAINICSGVKNIDTSLLEMARLYRFSKIKTLRHIILPSVGPYFRSGFQIVVGSCWKLVVMGEVLTTSTGIGGAITTARLNLESAEIIAWAFLLVVLCFVTQKALELIFFRKEKFHAQNI